MPIHKTTIRNLACSVVLSLSFIAPVIAADPAPMSAVPSAAISTIGIDNFGRVNANYYRGAQPRGRDFADLKALGIRLVVDLAREGDQNEAANVEAAGMRFVRIPLTTGEAPSRAAVDRFLTLVNDPANQPAYVHCMGGRHRTGALTAVYRMIQDGWTADRAFSEMKQYRFGSDFLHPELKKFVYSYFSLLREGQTTPKVLVAAGTPGVQ